MKKNQYVTLLRIIHSLIVLYLVSGIVYIYYSAITWRFNLLLGAVIISLIIEGVLVYINHGNCPLAFVQQKVGDDTPFFELLLPKKYARYAVRFFALLTLFGLLLLSLRLSLRV